MAVDILCRVEGCGKRAGVPGAARGFCVSHYSRWNRYGDPLAGGSARERGRLCSVDGCKTKHCAHGYCQAHLLRFKKYGDPTAHHEKYRCAEKWIEDHKTYDGDDCLKWPFGVSSNGRGVVGNGKDARSASRAMCIAAHGSPPSMAHETAHSCGNGHLGCMNPKHLRWDTHMGNVRDRAAHGRDRRGTQINTNKLSENDVREIRRRRGSQTGVSLAKEFGVTPAAISIIQRGKNWAWLK